MRPAAPSSAVFGRGSAAVPLGGVEAALRIQPDVADAAGWRGRCGKRRRNGLP
jgi:hypothetical protein